MMRYLLRIFASAALMLMSAPSFAQQWSFHVLALYSKNVEPDHVMFAEQAIEFFTKVAATSNFDFKASTNWDDLNAASSHQYQVILWLNDSPHSPAQREGFERYMEHGGAWLGFHAAGYNDNTTHWPWFLDFLGGAVFNGNSWPPLPAKLVLDDKTHPVNADLPATFTSPANEWYLWRPDPRANNNVKVLATLDSANYPLGLKDVLLAGDLPVVWTNTKYKMVYINMGHGDRIFESPVQNLLFKNAILWLGSMR